MITDYITYLRYTKGYGENTIKAYSNALINFVTAMAAKGLRWSTIIKDDIECYLAGLKQSGKSVATIVQHISAIRGIFNWMARQYGIENPSRYIQSPKRAASVPHIISMDDVKRVLVAERNPQIRIGIALMAFVGLRVSEVRNMRYEDIDRVSGRVLVVGKGKKERYVYIPQSIIALLGEKQGFIIEYEDRDFRYLVFQSFRKFGIYCSPHMLRHTFATWSLDNGMRLDVLREVLGHTSLATTQIYLHIRPQVVRKELAKCNI